MANSDPVPNPDFDNWRQSVASAESDIESLEADERIVQKNSDSVMRNAMLHLAFFVAFTNGLAVLFTSGINLSCIWFSVVSSFIGGMFLLGMVLPIWYGFRQMCRYKDKLQNCVVRRRILKTAAINLLERHQSFYPQMNHEVGNLDVLSSVQKLETMRDSEFMLQDQDKLHRNLFVLILVFALGYAVMFPFVAHTIFCEGKNNIAQPPFPTHFQQAQTNQTGGSNGIDGITEVDGQITSAQQFPYQSTETMEQSPVASPFGTLPTVRHMSTVGPRATPVVRYRISSKPVSKKPSSVRSSSLLTTPKYNPKRDGPMVTFFSDAHMTPSAAKAEALFRRENPRSMVTGPTEEWNLIANFDNSSVVKHTYIHVYENGNISVKVSAPVVKWFLISEQRRKLGQIGTSKGSAASADHPAPKEYPAIVDEPVLKITCSFSSMGFSGGSDVMKLMPELRHTDYYIEPQVEESAVKESCGSGFCSHVKDFVVRQLGYGSIKFLGETDVRELDIESHIQFNDREVVVYMDETKKPPVGQCFNKPAKITLSNLKCVDKKAGKQYIDGPKVDKYKDTLIKKTAEQGAEFVSYDPVQGEWKINVQHF